MNPKRAVAMPPANTPAPAHINAPFDDVVVGFNDVAGCSSAALAIASASSPAPAADANIATTARAETIRRSFMAASLPADLGAQLHAPRGYVLRRNAKSGRG